MSQIEFTLNGETAQATAGESIFKAAQRHGVELPHLCFKDGLRAEGNCRACVVEVEGERALACELLSKRQCRYARAHAQ